MRAYKEVLVRKKELDCVICNMCGEEIKKDSFGHVQEHISIEKQWGYSSPHDGETHSIDLCQSCYEKLMSQLKIPPITQN